MKGGDLFFWELSCFVLRDLPNTSPWAQATVKIIKARWACTQ